MVAKFNASQLITQRQQVSMLIRKQLTDRARDFNIILDDVAITELSFGREYAAAVESKQVAQQEAQRAAFIVDRAIQEKQQKIVQAEGEAKSAEMLGEAISKNPGYLKLRKLRASGQIAKTVSDSWRIYLPWKLLDRSSVMRLKTLPPFCYCYLNQELEQYVLTPFLFAFSVTSRCSGPRNDM